MVKVDHVSINLQNGLKVGEVSKRFSVKYSLYSLLYLFALLQYIFPFFCLRTDIHIVIEIYNRYNIKMIKHVYNRFFTQSYHMRTM